MTIERPMFPPRAESRRDFLSLAAVATGGVLAFVSSVPPAVAATPDPIFAAIDKHKAARIPWDAAIDVRAVFPENAFPRTPEESDELDRLNEAVDTAWNQLEEIGAELISTAPTTLAGIVRAIQYLREQMQDDGTYMPHHLVIGDDTADDPWRFENLWIDTWLGTIAAAVADLDTAGKAVHS